MSLPKIVVIGGGTGMPVLLRGLKKYSIDLTTLVTVADDGGSSGKLRSELDVPAPGDIRNVLASLSEAEHDLTQLFQHRFSERNGLSGHALGNLILIAMGEITGDFHTGIEHISKILNIKGKVIPIVNESVTLNAKYEDGAIIQGESNIPLYGKKIEHVFLNKNNLKPSKHVIDVILDADLIVVSPGSLYTSIIPNLIVPEVSQALEETQAECLYVCNLMTQYGETDNYTASDHVRAIYQHTENKFLDGIIVNKEPITSEMQKRYALEKSQPVIYDKERLAALGLNVLEYDIIKENELLRHDTKKLAKLLYQIALKSMNKKGE